MLRHLLQRHSSSKIGYANDRLLDTIARLIHSYREKSQKVIRNNTFLLPDSLQYLPFYLYCFKQSELMSPSPIKDVNRLEYVRREIVRANVAQQLLMIAPAIYSLKYYQDCAAEELLLPNTIAPSLKRLEEGGLLESPRHVPGGQRNRTRVSSHQELPICRGSLRARAEHSWHQPAARALLRFLHRMVRLRSRGASAVPARGYSPHIRSFLRVAPQFISSKHFDKFFKYAFPLDSFTPPGSNSFKLFLEEIHHLSLKPAVKL